MIRIHCGKPIPTAELTIDGRHRLREGVREEILAGFDPDLQPPGELRG